MYRKCTTTSSKLHFNYTKGLSKEGLFDEGYPQWRFTQLLFRLFIPNPAQYLRCNPSPGFSFPSGSFSAVVWQASIRFVNQTSAMSYTQVAALLSSYTRRTPMIPVTYIC
jgi:hypothetical protein